MTTSSGFLDQSQREILASALNRLIPPSGAMPGAGDLGLSAFVEGAVGGNPRQRRLLTDGLAQLEIAASRQGGSGFGQLEGETQDAVLREIQSQTPVFFDALLRQCYNGYYTNPQVLDLIGYQTPSPETYVYQPLDETLLEPQRQRAPFWTQV